MFQVLVIGVVTGTIYGLFALGITLVYRGTRSVNFAQGELGTFSLYVAYLVTEEWGLPWIVGAIAAIAVAALIAIGYERFIVHRIGASTTSVTVASVGLLSLLLAVEFKMFGASPRTVDAPISGSGLRLAGTTILPHELLAIALTAAIAIGLTRVLRQTDLGLGVLATAHDQDAARLMGVPARRVAAFVWGTAGALAALAALFIEPSIHVFAPGFASELFLKGLAAAVVGGLANLNGAFIGGLIVGILEASALRIFDDVSLPGINFITYLVILLVVLLWRPEGVLRARGRTA